MVSQKCSSRLCAWMVLVANLGAKVIDISEMALVEV